MPFINVKANIPVGKDREKVLKAALGEAVGIIPGKSEDWLMVGIEPEYTLYFKGSDSPAAMVEVSIFGSTDKKSMNSLTEQICMILNRELSIPPARVYVKYYSTPDWGWNSANF